MKMRAVLLERRQVLKGPPSLGGRLEVSDEGRKDSQVKNGAEMETQREYPGQRELYVPFGLPRNGRRAEWLAPIGVRDAQSWAPTNEHCCVGTGQEFRCYSMCSGEPFMGFKQENGVVLFAV